MRKFGYAALFLLPLILITATRGQSTAAVVTSIEFPITGMVSVPLDGSLDWVTLSGTLHIVTVVTDPSIGAPVKAYANVSYFQGVGESGLTYNVVGAEGLAFAYPGAGAPIDETFIFEILREGSDVETFPLVIHGSLLFRPGGHVSNLTIHSIVVD